ncbi:hypothetical protein QFZ77_005857 [Paenibacillus sp. V4I3]|nr:hypothetical protein [Paenibacillus sp. V4I3]MDQ0886923.1 hypothetical protein [Paenibacillus sp. V4I9]
MVIPANQSALLSAHGYELPILWLREHMGQCSTKDSGFGVLLATYLLIGTEAHLLMTQK